MSARRAVPFFFFHLKGRYRYTYLIMRNSTLDGDVALQNEPKDHSLEQPNYTHDPFKLFQQLKNKAPSMASLKKTLPPSAQRPVSLLRSCPMNEKSRLSEQAVPLSNHHPTRAEQIWSLSSDADVLKDIDGKQSSTRAHSARAAFSAKNRAKAQTERLRVRKSKPRPTHSIVIGNNSPTILVFGNHHGTITQCPNPTPSSSATNQPPVCDSCGRGR